MDDKVKIEIFGIKNQPAGGSCSCGGNCGPYKLLANSMKNWLNI